MGSTFRRAGAVRVLDLFAIGLARVPVRFAVGAADWFIHLNARALFRGRLLGAGDFGIETGALQTTNMNPR